MEPESAENLRVLREVVDVFERLGLVYALGGSWASSMYGKPRFTQDADFLVDGLAGKEAELCTALGPTYYSSLPAVRDAVRRQASFNLIHMPTSYKIDVFVRKQRPYDQAVLQRRCTITLAENPPLPIAFISPEDTILLKLEWYRLGGEASERQLLDVLEVYRAQESNLNQAYLDQWAQALRIADLLHQLRQRSVPPANPSA